MSARDRSPVVWVQNLQALVARELVEELGIPQRRAASLLGIAPSAVSQYLSGKRLAAGFSRLSVDPEVRRIAREVAERLEKEGVGLGNRTSLLLDAARALSRLPEPSHRPGESRPAESGQRTAGESRAMARWLRDRVTAEQAAVTQCMHLAQRARDELTRAIFRQIASDSLRHAEIVASLATYLGRGVSHAAASGVTPSEVSALIESERRAEAQADSRLAGHLGGTMALLIASMEADERKHANLLQGLLDSGFLQPRARPRGSTRAPAASRSTVTE